MKKIILLSFFLINCSSINLKTNPANPDDYNNSNKTELIGTIKTIFFK